MKLALAAGIAVAALACSAFAQDRPNPDANSDAWLTRAEASAMADHVFAQLDSNHDGKLDANDHPADHMMFQHHHGGHGDDDHDRGGADSRHSENEHFEHRVIVRRDDGTLEHAAPPAPPGAPGESADAPRPPHPPMFMMLMANSEEADANHDGALSLEEFRTQHLRFFDASDANGDGRIRFEHPPEPPEAQQTPPPPR